MIDADMFSAANRKPLARILIIVRTFFIMCPTPVSLKVTEWIDMDGLISASLRYNVSKYIAFLKLICTNS